MSNDTTKSGKGLNRTEKRKLLSSQSLIDKTTKINNVWEGLKTHGNPRIHKLNDALGIAKELGNTEMELSIQSQLENMPSSNNMSVEKAIEILTKIGCLRRVLCLGAGQVESNILDSETIAPYREKPKK